MRKTTRSLALAGLGVLWLAGAASPATGVADDIRRTTDPFLRNGSSGPGDAHAALRQLIGIATDLGREARLPGIYEYMLITRALETSPEWVVSITSGPLGEQVILYFIIFNSLLEIFLVPLALLLNWNLPRRRVFVMAAGLLFYAIRIWTYLYFAPQYFDFGEMAFSEQLIKDLKVRMSIDNIRFAIQTLEACLFFCAALIPISIPAGTGQTIPE